MAGKATTSLKLPGSVQIVLRALIEEGLKRDGARSVLGNISAQAQAVRRIRSLARKWGIAGERAARRPDTLRRAGGSQRQRE